MQLILIPDILMNKKILVYNFTLTDFNFRNSKNE